MIFPDWHAGAMARRWNTLVLTNRRNGLPDSRMDDTGLGEGYRRFEDHSTLRAHLLEFVWFSGMAVFFASMMWFLPRDGALIAQLPAGSWMAIAPVIFFALPCGVITAIPSFLLLNLPAGALAEGRDGESRGNVVASC